MIELSNGTILNESHIVEVGAIFIDEWDYTVRRGFLCRKHRVHGKRYSCRIALSNGESRCRNGDNLADIEAWRQIFIAALEQQS